MTDEHLDAARNVLRDLHRTALMRDDKHNSVERADEFVAVTRGLEDLQADEVRDAIYRAWAIREGTDAKRRALVLLKGEGIERLVWYARNGQSGVKPLPLFTLNETENTRDFYISTAKQYGYRADLWQAAADKHAEQPELPLGQVLEMSELIALADASLEAEAI